MEFRSPIFVIVLSLLAQLSFAAPIHSDVIQTNERTSHDTFHALATAQHSLTLVSFEPVVVAGKTLGGVLVYDDPTTKRPVDYLEVYDGVGKLVALGWFDQFGIQRIAVDRGFLENANELDGVFVFFLEGDSI